jgi:hypothetical protein
MTITLTVGKPTVPAGRRDEGEKLCVAREAAAGVRVAREA